MIEVKGKGGIVVRVLKHSIGKESGVELITFECTYPRLIHCELLTHGMLCFNAASSRATPFDKMVQNLDGAPVRFGANQAGMQDKGEDYKEPITYWVADFETNSLKLISTDPVEAWNDAKDAAIQASQAFYNAGYHKQVYNRLTEPFQMMKTLISGTEFANFFWLRYHDAADPTLAELARCMYEAAVLSEAEELNPGEWHLPYIHTVRRENGELWYYIDSQIEVDGNWVEDAQWLTLEEAQIVSAARCAAVSFRNVDYTLDKSRQVYERLLGDNRKHGSAFQHQGTPMKPRGRCENPADGYYIDTNWSGDPDGWQDGISHADREGNLWSAQFKEWVQLRKLIPGENVPGFLPPLEKNNG